MATGAQRLAAEIQDLRRRLEGLERAASADLRSIDDGTFTAYDENGDPIVEVGLQPDGTYGVRGLNGGKVLADEAREGTITAAAILDGAVGPEKASFYGEVTQAQADASQAQTDAAQAQTDAAAAQQKADDAEQQALDALGVANSKSEVVYQATAPTGDASVFWVNTSTGRGHRWDGSSWVEIQDEDVQTALSDAAAAQSAADTAQQAANDAQSAADAAQARADQAVADAATAQGRADDAYALADGKVQTFFGSTDPTGSNTVDVGDLWFDASAGKVVKRWNGSGWDTLQDEDVQQALSDAASAQAAADGKITTFYGSTTPTAEGVGDLWVDPSRDNLTLRWDGAGWVSLALGSNAIADGAITETKVEDDAISTPKIRANAVTATHLEAVMAIVTRIVAGDPDGARAEMSGSGFSAFDVNGVKTFQVDQDGNVEVVGSVQSTDYVEAESGWRLDSLNVQVPNLNALDSVGAEEISSRTMNVDGEDFATEIAPRFSTGVKGYGRATGSTDTDPIDANTASGNGWIIGEFDAGDLPTDRVYAVHWHLQIQPDSNGMAVGTELTYTTDGSTPYNTSTFMRGSQTIMHSRVPNANMTINGFTTYEPSAASGETEHLKIGIRAFVADETGTAGSSSFIVKTNARNKPEIYLVDLGPKNEAANNLVLRHLSDGSGTGTATSTYTKSWGASWGRSFDGDGSVYQNYGSEPNDLYQGYYSGTHGNSKSMVGFNAADIQSKLSGATIKKVELTFRVRHSYYGSGLDVRIGTHNQGGKPNSFSNVSAEVAQRNGVNAGSTVTVTLPDSVGEDFKNGNVRGITFGPGQTTGKNWYGYMYGEGSGSEPKLKITYEK